MILFDAHVHMYDRFDLDRMIDAAFRNFQGAMSSLGVEEGECTCFLLLSESGKLNYFQLFVDTTSLNKQDSRRRWKVAATGESCSVRVCHNDFPGTTLFVVAGRQLVTAERLELLALLTEDIFPEHMSFETAVAEVSRRGGIPVCPWGAGKWLGKRGRILTEFMQSPAGAQLFLGDSGGRPLFWPAPKLLQKAEYKNRIVSGTDPLPLAGEELRVGSFGGYLAGSCSSSRPATGFKDYLSAENPAILPFGRSLSSLAFFKNQIFLRHQR